MEVVFDKLRLLSGRAAEGIVGRAMASHPGTQELEVEMRRGVPSTKLTYPPKMAF